VNAYRTVVKAPTNAQLGDQRIERLIVYAMSEQAAQSLVSALFNWSCEFIEYPRLLAPDVDKAP
jgi:hypothetical protein